MAETYTGEIRNGVVVLYPIASLPEGTKVRVEPVDRLDVLTAESSSDPSVGTRTMLLAWAQGGSNRPAVACRSRGEP